MTEQRSWCGCVALKGHIPRPKFHTNSQKAVSGRPDNTAERLNWTVFGLDCWSFIYQLPIRDPIINEELHNQTTFNLRSYITIDLSTSRPLDLSTSQSIYLSQVSRVVMKIDFEIKVVCCVLKWLNDLFIVSE